MTADEAASDPWIETKITNPGIADRLENDVTGFEQYGFSFDSKSKIFRAPPPQQASSRSSQSCNHQHLWVTIPKPALVASVGPFLRALVRMSDGVDPQTLRVVVSFCWGEGGGDCECDDAKEGDSDASAAVRIAHHVHMIVRNSMSAALFLTSLSILLPNDMPVSQVRNAMKENEDVNYPTITLLERRVEDNNCDEKLLDGNYLADAKEGRPSPPICIDDYISCDGSGGMSARVLVQTRMCTVRLTPLLYHLARELKKECHVTTRDDTKAVAQIMQDQSTSLPKILACVDKVANLFRIIMLARDYKAQHKLIVVVRDERIQKRLEAEMTKFIAGLDPVGGCGNGMPRVETIDGTAALLEKECSGKIVAVDLHPGALTLDETNDGALSALRSAGAVIWGFEKDGIPEAIDEMSECYVQVRCRSSLNLVAAMSVVLHRGWSCDIVMG